MRAEEELIGDLLVARGVLDLAALDEARALAERWKVPLADALMARRALRPLDYYRTLAQHFDLELADLRSDPPDPTLLDPALAQEYVREGVIPWRRDERGIITVAVTSPGPAAVLAARRLTGQRQLRLAVCTRFDVSIAVQRAFRSELVRRAVYGLAETDPDMSARRVVTDPQLLFFYLLLTLLAAGLAFAPLTTLIGLNLLMSVFYLGNFVFKGVLAWAGGLAGEGSARALETAARLLREDELPTFTVLVPMFREPEVLPILAHALRNLDYPLGKLDIKIVLEEKDEETIAAARALGLEGVFEIMIVPASQPQTKPKACNYALQFARGDYLVIYDAEDKPEPDQLRKVVAAFRAAPPNTACIQCRLNYYNARENWLTRMFTLDYSLWFDLMLPGLERLGVPIPLGGTSNHFRTEVLRELSAWDPFNVTEDADLGIRLTQKGYRVGVIDSTTFEEANCRQGNWIRQRSRWIKGYMQTFLVHTRRPIHLLRTVGPLGMLGFVFFIGGTMLSGILNPIFWTIFGFWALTQTGVFDPVFPPLILWLSVMNLLLGNALFIYLTMVAPFRRRWLELAPWALTVPYYWVLLSIAAYKALWQLIRKPFYWEKTQHGLSKQMAEELAKAGVAARP
ncbi:MAG: glycosyltransferase family 2 protein [Rhodovarius sp.]|nr:glycosyltransferase family 2 protein [Rhodovarius sp.]